MSWITATLLIVLAGFVCTFLLCEWIVDRRKRSGGDDPSATG